MKNDRLAEDAKIRVSTPPCRITREVLPGGATLSDPLLALDFSQFP